MVSRDLKASGTEKREEGIEEDEGECMLYNPEDGGCMVEESGDPQADRASVVEALQAMLDKESQGGYEKVEDV